MAKPQLSLADTLMNAPHSGVVERPKPLPVGSYLVKIVGQPIRDESTKKGTPYVTFNGEILEAFDDVDEGELKEWSKREGGEPRKLRGTTSPRITFYTTPDAISRLDKFLSDVGVLRKGPSRDDMIEECVGKEVVINIKHVLSDDGENTYANVKYTAPVSN